jgi:hypothetical protein
MAENLNIEKRYYILSARFRTLDAPYCCDETRPLKDIARREARHWRPICGTDSANTLTTTTWENRIQNNDRNLEIFAAVITRYTRGQFNIKDIRCQLQQLILNFQSENGQLDTRFEWTANLVLICLALGVWPSGLSFAPEAPTDLFTDFDDTLALDILNTSLLFCEKPFSLEEIKNQLESLMSLLKPQENLAEANKRTGVCFTSLNREPFTYPLRALLAKRL